MKRVLVTGGAGFIGSHIVEELLKRGYFVRVLDNFSSGKQENLKFTRELANPRTYELIKGDIRSKQTCLKATEGIDAILHQAALRSVPKSLFNPKDYNEVNIQGTLNLLKSALDNKIKRFVFASSSSVYGETEIFPEKEDFLTQPISPYALTKLTGEHYCRIFSYHYNLPTVSLRYFNVFGPRQSLDDEYAVVVPKFISCMLKDEHPPIYGTGRQSRDFTYVGNVVEANIMAIERPCVSRHSGTPHFAGKGDIFNIASGKDYSVLELVKFLNKIMKKNIKPVYLSVRPGDVFRTLADLSRSKKLLRFRPKVDFVQGLKLTLDYFQDRVLQHIDNK